MTSSYRSLVLAHPNLVAYWPLDEAAGSATVSDVKNGHTGTVDGGSLGNASLVPRSRGASYRSSSNGNSIDIPDHADFASTPMSVEAWFVFDGTHTSGLPIFNRRNTSNVGGFTIQTGTSGGMDFYIYTSSFVLLNTTGWTVGQRWHGVWTYDGHFQRAYRNGVLVGTSVDRNASINDPASPNIKIAEEAWTASGTSWKGAIDELAFYNDALTAADIAKHYTVGRVAGQRYAPFQLRPGVD